MAQPSQLDIDQSIATIGGRFGLVAVALNILGIVTLKDVVTPYQIGGLDNWIASIPNHAGASSLSALSFVFAVLTMIPYAWALQHRDGRPGIRLGALSIAIGALMNAVACLVPFVVATHVLPSCSSPEACLPIARGMLGYAITMDGLFNALLGSGLLAIGITWLKDPERRKPAIVGLLAGLFTLPVALQPISDACQQLLVVGGPLWLLFITMTSIELLREPS